MKLLQIKI